MRPSNFGRVAPASLTKTNFSARSSSRSRVRIGNRPGAPGPNFHGGLIYRNGKGSESSVQRSFARTPVQTPVSQSVGRSFFSINLLNEHDLSHLQSHNSSVPYSGELPAEKPFRPRSSKVPASHDCHSGSLRLPATTLGETGGDALSMT